MRLWRLQMPGVSLSSVDTLARPGCDTILCQRTCMPEQTEKLFAFPVFIRKCTGTEQAE